MENNYWESAWQEAFGAAEKISAISEKHNLVRVMAKTQKLLYNMMRNQGSLGYLIQQLPLDVCNIYLGIGGEGMFSVPDILNEDGAMESLVRATGDLRCLAILTARQQAQEQAEKPEPEPDGEEKK